MLLRYRANPGSGKRFAFTVYDESMIRADPVFTGTCDEVEVKTIHCDADTIQLAVYCDDNIAFVDKVECI